MKISQNSRGWVVEVTQYSVVRKLWDGNSNLKEDLGSMFGADEIHRRSKGRWSALGARWGRQV